VTETITYPTNMLGHELIEKDPNFFSNIFHQMMEVSMLQDREMKTISITGIGNEGWALSD